MINSAIKSKWIISLTLLLALSGCAKSVSINEMKVVASFLTTGVEGPNPKRIPQTNFSTSDVLYYLTAIKWEPVGSNGGYHNVSWKWYANGSMVSEFKQSIFFKLTPYEIYSWYKAYMLGKGHQKVELYIDGKLFDTQEFEIV
jgi:hypothetical protein